MVLLVSIAPIARIVAILTIRDEDHNELFGVWVATQNLLDLHEDVHEVGAATSANLIDASSVRVQIVLLEALDIVVVDHRVELIKGALLSVVVLLSDEQGADLEGIDGCSGHRA